MFNKPDDAPESFIHKLFDGEPERATRLLGNPETVFVPTQVIDLRNKDLDIRYEFHGSFRGKQMWTCWDANRYDGPESIMGHGESREDALVDLMDQTGAEAVK